MDGLQLPKEAAQRRWSDDERTRIRLMRDSGESFGSIGQAFRASESQVRAQYHSGAPAVMGGHLQHASLDRIADKIIRPGIDKKLVPLCLYMGTRSFGRIHRWWNFSLAAMEQGAASASDVAKLSHHPDFSHLCGTTSKSPLLSVQGFFTRLRDNPDVTDNISGMTEWARMILPRQFQFRRIPLYTFEKNAAEWREYRAKPTAPSNVRKAEAPACYPFIMHDPKRISGADLVAQVNKAVPRGLPEEIRADICQDLICAILAGDFSVENLKGNVSDFIKAGRKMFADKWSFVPLDAPIPGMDGKTFMETI